MYNTFFWPNFRWSLNLKSYDLKSLCDMRCTTGYLRFGIWRGYKFQASANFSKLLSYVFSASAGKQQAGSCFMAR